MLRTKTIMMLTSSFRLRAHGRIAVSLLKRTMSTHTNRPHAKILNSEEETSSFDIEKDEIGVSRKKNQRTNVFRQNKLDGQFYIKSEFDDEPEEQPWLEDKPVKPHCFEETDDHKLSRHMLIVKSRKMRRKKGITLLEGKRLVKDALLAGVRLKALFVSRRTDLQALPLPTYNFNLHWMPYHLMEKWSDVQTSSGVLAIVEIPSTLETSPDPNSLPLTVICDNIRDPGNMGAIVRVLAGVGCKKILITKGCVDIWEPKVLRAGAGAHFRVPIEYDIEWNKIDSLIHDEEASVFLADTSSPVSTEGISEPKQVSDSDSEEDDDTTDMTSRSNSLITEVPPPTASRQEILPTLPYHLLNFNVLGDNILVISNESFGPSPTAVAFTSTNKGVKITIPLCGNVESLNVVSALSIIAFEMKRQAVMS